MFEAHEKSGSLTLSKKLIFVDTSKKNYNNRKTYT